MKKKIIRDLSTEENRLFWWRTEQIMAEVSTWPAWKRAGINVAQSSKPKTKKEKIDDVA